MCAGLNENDPCRRKCLSLGHQGVEFSEGIRRIRRRGPVGGSVSLRVGFEVPKAHARPSLSLCLLPAGHDGELSATSPASVFLCAALLPGLDEHLNCASETVSQSSVKCFLL